MTKLKIKNILEKLDELYPNEDKSFLDYSGAWQLMVATILAAQCTDARVNAVTPVLFAKYPSPEDLAGADIEEVAEIIRPTGFFRGKSANIVLSMRRLMDEHNGEMPSGIEDLTAFPGVGRKTANVIRGHIFNLPSIVVDTHVKRVSNRLGIIASDDPVKIEFELMKVLPEEHWIRYNTQIITHGRAVCAARSPKCGGCGLAFLCDERRKSNSIKH
ncbi:MAG: endonuclease III [Clostridiales bacterium]|nr:endonuclease III [Clostridiales bacterium]